MQAPKLQLVHFLNVQPRAAEFDAPTVIKVLDREMPVRPETITLVCEKLNDDAVVWFRSEDANPD